MRPHPGGKGVAGRYSLFFCPRERRLPVVTPKSTAKRQQNRGETVATAYEQLIDDLASARRDRLAKSAEGARLKRDPRAQADALNREMDQLLAKGGCGLEIARLEALRNRIKA